MANRMDYVLWWEPIISCLIELQKDTFNTIYADDWGEERELERERVGKGGEDEVDMDFVMKNELFDEIRK